MDEAKIIVPCQADELRRLYIVVGIIRSFDENFRVPSDHWNHNDGTNEKSIPM